MDVIMKETLNMEFEKGDVLISTDSNTHLLIQYLEYDKDDKSVFTVFDLNKLEIRYYDTYEEFDDEFPIMKIIHHVDYDIVEKGAISYEPR